MANQRSYTSAEIAAVPHSNPYHDRLLALNEQRNAMPFGIDRDIVDIEITTLMERVKSRQKMLLRVPEIVAKS